MDKDNMEIIEIEVDSDLLEQLKELLTPMGLTPEELAQRFIEWCVDPETKDSAMAWLLEHKDEVM